MKFRNGFVSNSSSSSFICDVSGEVESGWDLSLRDAGMRECVNGHTFKDEYLVEGDDDEMSPEMSSALIELCESGNETDEVFNNNVDVISDNYSVDRDELIRFYQKYDGEYYGDDDDDYDSYYEVPAHRCPICTMSKFNDTDLLNYLVAKSGKTREQIEDEVRKDTGSNYDTFSSVITGE